MELSHDGRSAWLKGRRATILEAHTGGWCHRRFLPSVTFGLAVVEPENAAWFVVNASECSKCRTRIVE